MNCFCTIKYAKFCVLFFGATYLSSCGNSANNVLSEKYQLSEHFVSSNYKVYVYQIVEDKDNESAISTAFSNLCDSQSDSMIRCEPSDAHCDEIWNNLSILETSWENLKSIGINKFDILQIGGCYTIMKDSVGHSRMYFNRILAQTSTQIVVLESF